MKTKIYLDLLLFFTQFVSMPGFLIALIPDPSMLRQVSNTELFVGVSGAGEMANRAKALPIKPADQVLYLGHT